MASYNDMDGTPTQGAGYSEEDIDNGTGLAPTSTAVVGYNPLDGTYTSKSQKYRQTRLQMLPTDTDRPRINRANAAVNEANKALYTNPKVSGLLSLYDEQSGGHGFEPYRDTLDDYMAHEYGRSKYDKESGDLNVLTSDRAKANRAEEQTSLAVLANGLPRLAVRAATTVGSAVGGVVKGIADALGGNSGVDEYFSPEAMAGYADSFGDWMNKAVPVYQTREQEEAMENDPLSLTSLTSGQNVANFVDNVGFTLGAVIAARTFGKAGQSVMTGAAAMQLGSAAGKWLTDDDYKASNLIPLIMGVGMGGMSKALPKHLREKLAFVAANIMSAAGEAEVEAVHAKEDFIKEKGSVIDQEVARRKGLVAEEYRKMAGQAWAKAYNDAKAAGMDEASALEAADNAGEEAMATLADQMAILDWEGTRVKNRSISEADKAANVTRMLNLGVLTASNWIQFGRLFSGGYKTYRTMRGMAAAKGARDAADAAFDAALRGARTTAEKTAVRESRDAIRAEAMRRWAAETGQDVWQQTGKLTKRNLFDIIVKNPLTEGAEEMEQAMASNAAKAASEWRTDDYYSQISGTEAYREAESAVGAAWQSAFGTLGDAQAWSEFLSGALMGAIGVPWLRSPFKKIGAPVSEADPTGAKADDKGIGGKLRAFRKLRSPLFFQGGIYGEWKAASEKREKMAAMATRLNEAMSDKGVERLRKLMGHIAHHMQYEKDKAMYADKAGSKYLFQNADDADLLNTLEMYQDSGNMDVFRGLVASMRGIKTAEELAQFRDMTSEDDGKGGKSGPYSEFNVMKLGPEATEEQRAANEEQAEAMRKKIAEDADHLRKTIDTYEKARRNLDLETGQSLGEKELNCLTWYKTRLSMFDERAKDMYSGVSGLMDGLSSNLGEFEDAVLGEVEAAIEAIRSAGEAGAKLGALESMYAANAPLLRDVAFPELKRRLSEAAKADDDLAKARILFEGERKARPVIDTLAGRVGYATAWRGGKAEEERRRRQTAVSGLFEAIGAALRDDSTEAGKLMARLEPDADKRAEMADKMRDIKACQDAVVRYRDLYNLYRENPTVLTAAAKAQDEAVKEETKAEEAGEVKTRVDKAANPAESLHKAVGDLYDAVLGMIMEGEDPEEINKYLTEREDAKDPVVKAFMRNQRQVTLYAKALDRILLPVFGQASLMKSVILQTLIDASRVSVGYEEMHDEGRRIMDEVLKNNASIAAYVNDKQLYEDFGSDKDDLPENVMLTELGKDGKKIRTATGKDAAQLLRETVPYIMDAADKIVLRLAEPRPTMKYMSDEEIAAYNERLSSSTGNLSIDAGAKGQEVMDALLKVGDGGEDLETEAQSKVTGEGQEEEQNTAETETVTAESDKPDGETADDVQSSTEPVEDVVEETTVKEPVEDTFKEKAASEPATDTVDDATEETDEAGPTSPSDDEQSSEEAEGQEAPAEETPAEDATEDNPEDQEPVFETSVTELTAENIKTLTESNAYRAWMRTQTDKTNDIKPILSYYNLEMRSGHVVIRNDRVKFATGGMVKCAPGEAGWCQKFFATCEKLGMWRAIDEVSKDDPNYIKEGDPIYFVIDRMGENGKSQILGLDEDELSFGGKPIIWMCARRADGTYQAVGSLATSKAKLSEYGQTELDTYVRRQASKNETKAYVSDKTVKVRAVNSGMIELQDGENALGRVFAGATPRLLIYPKNGKPASNVEVNFSKDENLAGKVYALLRDERTEKDIPVLCHVAHYSAEDKARLGGTGSWGKVDAIIRDMTVAANDIRSRNNIGEALEKFQESYNELGDILALRGYGLHIDVDDDTVKLKRPERKKDGEFETETGPDGKERKVKERRQVNLTGDNVKDAEALREAIMEYNIPFRVNISRLDKRKDPDGILFKNSIKSLCDDGIITTNVADGGWRTRGGHVVTAPFREAEKEAAKARVKSDRLTVEKPVRETDQVVSRRVYGYTVEYKNDGLREECTFNGKVITDPALSEMLLALIRKKWPYEFIDETREAALFNPGDHYVGFLKFGDPRDPTDLGVRIADKYVRPDDMNDFKRLCDVTRSAARVLELRLPSAAYKYKAFKDANPDDTIKRARALINPVLANAKLLAEWKRSAPEIFDYEGDDAAKRRDRLADDISAVLQETGMKGMGFGEVSGLLLPTLNLPKSVTVNGREMRWDTTRRAVVDSDGKKADEFSLTGTLLDYAMAVQVADRAKREEEKKGKSEIKKGSEGSDSSDKKKLEINLKSSTMKTKKKPIYNMGSFSIVKPGDKRKPRVDVAKEMEALRRMLPSLTRADAVRFIDGLIETGRKGEWAQGLFRDGQMIISTLAVRGTVFHEGFHCIFQTALSDKQRRELLDDARRVAGNDRLADFEAEELLCDWFRDYAVEQVYGKSWTRRIKDFFRMLFHLSQVSWQSLIPVTNDVFCAALQGGYDSDGFRYQSVKEDRQWEWRRMGYTWDQIDVLEDRRNAWAARTAEERSMLADAGINEFSFNLLTPQEREEIIDCL